MTSFALKEIQCKSVINRVKGMPFSWSLNPYRGCRHACVYCYARPTHEYLGLNSGDQFQEVIFAKMNAPEVVRAELSRPSWRGESVVIGTATDPYQQAESQCRLTRQILEVFRDCGNPLSITTKSPMVLRDLDILDEINKHYDVCVCVTITTLDEKLWRLIEPTTSKPRKRLEAISVLRDHGIRAGVLLSPILPGLTDGVAHIEEVIAAAAEHGAQFVSGSVLRLGPGISDYYLPFIEREFPNLKRPYEQLYRGNYAPAFYTKAINDRVHDLKLKHGFVAERQPFIPLKPSEESPPGVQLELFAAVA